LSEKESAVCRTQQNNARPRKIWKCTQAGHVQHNVALGQIYTISKRHQKIKIKGKDLCESGPSITGKCGDPASIGQNFN